MHPPARFNLHLLSLPLQGCVRHTVHSGGGSPLAGRAEEDLLVGAAAPLVRCSNLAISCGWLHGCCWLQYVLNKICGGCSCSTRCSWINLVGCFAMCSAA